MSFWISHNTLDAYLMERSLFECKRKMIMSPLPKVEMSPLIGLKVVEVAYEGEGRDDNKRSRKAEYYEANR